MLWKCKDGLENGDDSADLTKMPIRGDWIGKIAFPPYTDFPFCVELQKNSRMRQRLLAELSAFLFAVLFGFSQSWGNQTVIADTVVGNSVHFESKLSHQTDLMAPVTFAGLQLGERSRVKVLSDYAGWELVSLPDVYFLFSSPEVLYRNLWLKFNSFYSERIYLKNRVLIL